MIEKELILSDLQKQLYSTEDEQTKIMLNELITNIVSGRYNVRVW